jgi:hypothetical protein
MDRHPAERMAAAIQPGPSRGAVIEINHWPSMALFETLPTPAIPCRSGGAAVINPGFSN